MQEGPPSLAGRSPPFDHVLGDARLRDLKPELEQFAVNAWRALKRIFWEFLGPRRHGHRVLLHSAATRELSGDILWMDRRLAWALCTDGFWWLGTI
jgi:hypothetical protein